MFLLENRDLNPRVVGPQGMKVCEAPKTEPDCGMSARAGFCLRGATRSSDTVWYKYKPNYGALGVFVDSKPSASFLFAEGLILLNSVE